MATKSENSEIAVLQTQMEDMNKALGKIDNTVAGLDKKLDDFAKLYVPIATFEEFKKRRWAENTLSAVAGVTLTTIVSATIYIIFGKK